MSYLFPNGTAMYFDRDGEQIPELQREQWEGVQEFREQYPEADVYFAVWAGEERYLLSDDALEQIGTSSSCPGGPYEDADRDGPPEDVKLADTSPPWGCKE